jgi:hypothetical protein
MRRHLTTLLVMTLVLARASLAMASVVVDHDHEADFSSFHTFTFKEGTPAKNPLTQGRIEKAIERELVAKGLRRDDAAPDLDVVTHASVEKSTQVRVDDYGYGYWHSWGPRTVDVYEVHVGTLVVDLVDAKAKRLAWRGEASAVVDPGMKPEKLEARINKVVMKMFKEYPPQ